MAWEWVGPVATATVGVFGMTATLVAARMNRKGQERQESAVRKRESFNWIREERYKCYRDVLVGVRQIQNAYRSSDSSRFDAMEVALTNLAEAIERVALVGSPATFLAAGNLIDTCRAIAMQKTRGAPRRGQDSGSFSDPQIWDTLESQRIELIARMKDDLPRVSTSGFEIAVWP